MSPGGFFGRLFGWIVYQIAQGLGLDALEATWERTYGHIDDATFAAAQAQAEQAVGNVERLLALPPGAPLSAALGGAPEPHDTVWVRTVMHWTDSTGSDHYRTIDIETEWDQTVAFVYAEAANAARNIADSYHWTLVDITVIPPLLF